MQTRARLAGSKKPGFQNSRATQKPEQEIKTPLESRRPLPVVVVSRNVKHFVPAIFKTRESQENWQLIAHHLVLASPGQRSSGRLGAA